MLHGSHHHRDTPVSLGTTEPSRKVRRQLQVLVRCSCCGGLENHMAPRAFLCMKPEISGSSLTQADPFVLAMVPPHLNQQSIPGPDFKGLGLPSWWTVAATFASGRQQLLQFDLQFQQLSFTSVSFVPVCLHQIGQKAFAAIDQCQSLIVVDQPLLDQRNGSPQPLRPLVKLLGLVNAVPVRRGLAEDGIRLLLQFICANGVPQALHLLPALRLFLLSALLEKLAQFLMVPAQLSLVQVIAVIDPQAKAERSVVIGWVGRIVPDAVATCFIEMKNEITVAEMLKPAFPALMKQNPLVFTDALDRGGGCQG